jgi:hypothetical protein
MDQAPFLTLNFSKEDIATINWVGYRYNWSEELQKHVSEPGPVEFTEEEVSELSAAFDRDTEGGHDFFPCLRPGSELASKLQTLYIARTEYD